jgi:hypothetical protein
VSGRRCRQVQRLVMRPRRIPIATGAGVERGVRLTDTADGDGGRPLPYGGRRTRTASTLRRRVADGPPTTRSRRQVWRTRRSPRTVVAQPDEA